jgi:hypothetical protein
MDARGVLIETPEDTVQIMGGGLLRPPMPRDSGVQKSAPVVEPAPVVEEALEAVIGRLLEAAPVDNEVWGEWA